MSNAHQHYRNPTIAEAICEIHFSTPEGKWGETWLNEYSERLKIDYPNAQTRQMKGIQAHLGENGVIAQQVEAIPRKILRHSARNHLIQVSPNLLLINQLPTYEGWEIFLKDIEIALNHIIAICSPEAVVRIGLRYINKILRKALTEKVGYWLAPSDYYPNRLQEINSRFLSRLEANEGENFRSIVTVAEAVSDSGVSPFIFDIDVIYENSVAIDSVDPVLKILDQQHLKIWNIFSQSLTPALESLLNEEKANV